MIQYCLLMMLTSLLAAAHLQAADKPNVVLILVDDLGWTDLACQGSRFCETPHLDRFTAAGKCVPENALGAVDAGGRESIAGALGSRPRMSLA